jgi:hypothetical protein
MNTAAAPRHHDSMLATTLDSADPAVHDVTDRWTKLSNVGRYGPGHTDTAPLCTLLMRIHSVATDICAWWRHRKPWPTRKSSAQSAHTTAEPCCSNGPSTQHNSLHAQKKMTQKFTRVFRSSTHLTTSPTARSRLGFFDASLDVSITAGPAIADPPAGSGMTLCWWLRGTKRAQSQKLQHSAKHANSLKQCA